jgi:hypothetical protein
MDRERPPGQQPHPAVAFGDREDHERAQVQATSQGIAGAGELSAPPLAAKWARARVVASPGPSWSARAGPGGTVPPGGVSPWKTTAIVGTRPWTAAAGPAQPWTTAS